MKNEIQYSFLNSKIQFDVPMPDEIEALKYAELNGEYIADSNIDWDNLDNINLG